MSLESTLVRIAVALEVIAASGVGVAAAAATEAPKKDEKPVAADKPKKDEKPVAADKPKKAEKPVAADKPKKAEKKEPEYPKIEAVRAALTSVQEAFDGKVAREVLATAGGNGALSKVKPARYQDVIDAAAVKVSDAS